MKKAIQIYENNIEILTFIQVCFKNQAKWNKVYNYLTIYKKENINIFTIASLIKSSKRISSFSSLGQNKL